jgi:hypothetical protein
MTEPRAFLLPQRAKKPLRRKIKLPYDSHERLHPCGLSTRLVVPRPLPTRPRSRRETTSSRRPLGIAASAARKRICRRRGKIEEVRRRTQKIPCIQPVGRPPNPPIILTVEKLEIVRRLQSSSCLDKNPSISSCYAASSVVSPSRASQPRTSSALYLVRRCWLAGCAMVSYL